MRRSQRSSGPALEPTYSRAEVMAHLGVQKSKLWDLCELGRRHRGCHPTKGGIYPVFRVSHCVLRIPAGAIERHKSHMMRLQEDEMFCAQMRARARELDGQRSTISRENVR